MSGIKVKDISYLMQEALNMNLAKEKKKVLMAINIAHKDTSEMRDWKKLRMKKSLVFSGTDIEIPSNAIGITGVISSTEVYFKSEEEDVLSVDDRPHWYYASQTGEDPSASQFINILDSDGAVASDTVNLFYWAYPKTLTGDNDDIIIPGPKALALASIVILVGLLEHRPSEAEPFRVEYDAAIQELLSRYPATSRSKVPTGRHGNRIAMGDIG